MINEKIVVGEYTKYPLKGILTLPDHANGSIPAVVFVHGSGASNMDEKVGKLTPFKDLAEGLARHGIASIRYDKRSFAHGLKMMRDKSGPITVREETIEDAVLATEFLKKDPRIDPGKVFIVGHSMGGMLAPRIDGAGGDYRGLVLMAGTPRRLEDIMVEQMEEALSTLNGLARKLAARQTQTLKGAFEGLYDLTDAEAMKRKVGGGTTLYYFKEMGEHPVSDYLASIQKPMLILQGEKDFQVKADRDFLAYQELLKDKPDVTFKLYENLNHAFVPSVYGSIVKAKKEYGIEQHISEAVIADIASWIMAVSAS